MARMTPNLRGCLSCQIIFSELSITFGIQIANLGFMEFRSEGVSLGESFQDYS